MVGVVVSLMQKPCGAFVPGVLPEPGCFCLGGIAYRPTVSTSFVRLSDGELELSEDVLVSDQTSRSVDVPVPGVQTAPELHCASSAASELMKYSVPPLSVLNCPGFGDCAGQSVKPGWPPTPECLVSICTADTVVAPAASAAFGSA